MVNLPYAGHTNPTLPLARALVARGHQVGYINAPEWREKIEAVGCDFIPYEEYPLGLTEQQKKTRCFLGAYRTLMRYGSSYDILLYEMLFFPAKEIADRLGIPCVRQFSQPAWNPATVGYAKRISPLWAVACRLIEMQMFNKKTAREMRMTEKRMVQSIVYEDPGLNIVYVPEELQPCRETLSNGYVFVLPKITDNDDQSFDYASMKRPVVYISMGSIMSSKRFCKRCIWAFGEKDMTVFLTTGKVPVESLGTLPPNIIARQFMPQIDILKHADLFITHGGMNSVNEAIHFGVPMLVLPVLNDQPINASMVEEIGIGLRGKAISSPKQLYENAVRVLSNESIRARINALSRQSKPKQGMEEAIHRIESILG